MRPGLADPVFDSQRIFRTLLEATAHPGRVVTPGCPADVPAPLAPATGAVSLTLFDPETPLWLDPAARTDEVVEWLRFHTGAPIVSEAGAARFAVIAGACALGPLDVFDAGSDDSPDRSATLVIQVDALTAGEGVRLSGPGIRIEARLAVAGLPAWFWDAIRASNARFPRGVDVVLTAGERLAALPRTVRIED